MTYAYDGGGALVKRTNADGTYTEYIGGIFEKTFSATSSPTGTAKYYRTVGRTIAMRPCDSSSITRRRVSKSMCLELSRVRLDLVLTGFLVQDA